jgi:hypothetical protein
MPGKHDDGGDLYSGSDTDNFDTEFDRLTTPHLEQQLFTAPPRGADPEERTAAATRRRQPPPLSTNQVRSSTHTHC